MKLDFGPALPPLASTFVAAAMDLLFEVRLQRPKSVAVRGIAISPFADLRAALATMDTYERDALPVIDDEGRVIGELRRAAAESYFPAAGPRSH